MACTGSHTRVEAGATILVLSFSRYGGQLGDANKNDCCIAWRDAIHVPVFTGGNELSSHTVEYDVVAAIMHHGDSVLAGHYTVHLTEADGHTICDDNAEPAFHARDPADGAQSVEKCVHVGL